MESISKKIAAKMTVKLKHSQRTKFNEKLGQHEYSFTIHGEKKTALAQYIQVPALKPIDINAFDPDEVEEITIQMPPMFLKELQEAVKPQDQ